MQAAKGIYEEENVGILTPLVDMNETTLLVSVLEANKQWVDLRNASKAINSEAERDFQTIGIKQFFDAKNDSNINWNHIFSVEFC